MSSKGAVIGLILSFACGFGLAHNAQPEPKVVTKVETVRIPEVITHVETKEINRPQPLPQSCFDIMPKLEGLTTDLHDIPGNANMIDDRLGTLGAAEYGQQDAKQLNQLRSDIKQYRDDLTGESLDLYNRARDIKPMLDQCKKDMQATVKQP